MENAPKFKRRASTVIRNSRVYNHVYSVKQIILLANIQHSEEMVSNCVNRDQIILDNKDQCNFLIGGNAVFDRD